jgi:hypothetical protein
VSEIVARAPEKMQLDSNCFALEKVLLCNDVKVLFSNYSCEIGQFCNRRTGSLSDDRRQSNRSVKSGKFYAFSIFESALVWVVAESRRENV